MQHRIILPESWSNNTKMKLRAKNVGWLQTCSSSQLKMGDHIFCLGFGKESNFVAVYPNFLKIGVAIFTGEKIDFIKKKTINFGMQDVKRLLNHGKQALHFLNSPSEPRFSHVILSNLNGNVKFEGEYIQESAIVSLTIEHQDG